MMPDSPAADCPFSIAQALAWACELLGGHAARVDAECLLGDAGGFSRAQIFAYPERLLDAGPWQCFQHAVRRLAAGEPLAYVRGRQGFWSLELEVSPATLIPRVETELLVELALARLPAHAASVLDLGTGSGAVALALASERPDCRVFAVDLSSAALAVAARNAQRHGLHNVEFLQSDWFAAVPPGEWDLIVSNPPYLAESDPHLLLGDLPAEPRAALAIGADGLDAIRQIAVDAPARLRPGAWLLLEHGWEQGAAVRELLLRGGLVEVTSMRDLEARERVSGGRRPAPGD